MTRTIGRVGALALLAGMFLLAPVTGEAEPQPRPKPAEAEAAAPAISRQIEPRTHLLGEAQPGRGGARSSAGSRLAGTPVNTEGDLEIESDTLELMLDDQVVIFRGQVDATKGGLRLRAAEVRAHYTEGEGGHAAGTFGDISRLEATGDVQVSTAEETLRGRRASYDVASERIVVNGDVTVSARGSVVRGERLDFNLATGLISLASAAPRAGTEADQSDGGRVRGLFSAPPSQDD